MMKLFITENIDKAIEGYTTIPIIYGEFDLATIPSNSATDIIAIDAIDSIKYEMLPNFIKTIREKMRLGCSLHLGGSDIYAINRALLSGSMDLEYFNKEIMSKTNISCANFIKDLMHMNEIFIDSIVFKGYKYEIRAKRQHTN